MPKPKNDDYIYEQQAEIARQEQQAIQNTLDTPVQPEEDRQQIDVPENSEQEERKKLLNQERQRIHNKYPINIMQKLREAQGLDENDISHDEELNTLSPSEAFEEVLDFEGYVNCAYQIKSIIRDIYGIDIDKLGQSLSQADIYPTEINDSDISPIQAYINAISKDYNKNAEKDLQEEFE